MIATWNFTRRDWVNICAVVGVGQLKQIVIGWEISEKISCGKFPPIRVSQFVGAFRAGWRVYATGFVLV